MSQVTSIDFVQSRKQVAGIFRQQSCTLCFVYFIARGNELSFRNDSLGVAGHFEAGDQLWVDRVDSARCGTTETHRPIDGFELRPLLPKLLARRALVIETTLGTSVLPIVGDRVWLPSN